MVLRSLFIGKCIFIEVIEITFWLRPLTTMGADQHSASTVSYPGTKGVVP